MKAIGTLFLVLFFITVIIKSMDGENVFHTNISGEDGLALVKKPVASSTEEIRRERGIRPYRESEYWHDPLNYIPHDPSRPSSCQEPLSDRVPSCVHEKE